MRLAIVMLVMTAATPVSAQRPPGQAGVVAARPLDWEATKARVRELTLDGKNQEVLALLEPIVAKYPGFADGLFWFGGAHEEIGRDLLRTNPKLAAARLETTASYYRRVLDLGGGDALEATLRGLIDLYDDALPNPETWKALILEARTRYPAEPVVHWYFAQLLIKEGRPGELPAGFKAARATLPAAPPDARLSFASFLAGLAERVSSIPVRTVIVAEARAYADETLKSHPTGYYGRQAQSIKDDLARLK